MTNPILFILIIINAVNVGTGTDDYTVNCQIMYLYVHLWHDKANYSQFVPNFIPLDLLAQIDHYDSG